MKKVLRNNETHELTVNIPKELMEFVKHDTYSLLIKGDAGTGKTTLALTLLLALGIKRNCLYLSTRISPEKLFKHYSWVEKYFDLSKKLDLNDISELATDIATFVDARLDEPSSLYERITNELMDIKSPIIIIDSWDAISFFMDKDSLVNNARVLQTWRERARAKLIFVSENPEDKTLDFLVDGIAILKKEYVDNRILREITFTKLHGIKIRRPSYLFTLHDSIFRSYDPYKPNDLIFSKVERHIETLESKIGPLQNHYVKSGYDALDEEIGGGFPLKGMLLIELEPHIDPNISLVFLNKLITNFIGSENFVVFHPFEGIKKEFVNNCVWPILSKTKKNEFFSQISEWDDTKQISKKEENTSKSTKKELVELYQNKVLDLLKHKNNKKVLSILGSNIFYGYPSSELERKTKETINFLKSKTDLVIVVTKSTHEKTYSSLSELAEVHFKIIEISGTLFLLSKTPWSHLFTLVPDKSQGYPKINLESMV